MDLGELGLSNPVLREFDPILPGGLDKLEGSVMAFVLPLSKHCWKHICNKPAVHGEGKTRMKSVEEVRWHFELSCVIPSLS